MQWTNNERGYGWVTISLHWIAAFGVLTMLAIGLRAGAMEHAHDEAGHNAAIAWHISVGMTLFVFLLARVVQHYVQKQPAPPPQGKLLNAIASLSHNVLLLAIIIMIVSGPMMIWAMARPIEVWGWFAIPSPFAEANRALRGLFDALHGLGRLLLFVLVPLHVLAAFKHLIFDRDGVLTRIFVARPGQSSSLLDAS